MRRTKVASIALAILAATSVTGPATATAVVPIVPGTAIEHPGSFSQAGLGAFDYRGRSAGPPAAGCSGIAAAATRGNVTVSLATSYPATPVTPAFCDVQGTIKGAIGFEIALPASWNRRLYVWGNGGWAGEPYEQFTTNRDNALAAGFVYAHTNTGHTGCSAGPGCASVFTNPTVLLDWAYLSVHLLAGVAKAVTREYYGFGVEHSYFEGCSTGGRQAMVEAQRYPADFDGIIAGDPANLGTNLYLSGSWVAQAYFKGPFTLAQANTIGARLIAKCGERANGVPLGVIEDPRTCAFDPKKDGAGLSAAQLAAYETIVGGAVNKHGRIAYGEVLGAEFGTGYTYVLPPAPVNIGYWTPISIEDYASGFLQYLAPYKQPGATFSMTGFDFNTNTYQLEPIRKVVDSFDPDLSAFAARGGKLIGYHGWADPLIPPYDTVDYYESTWNVMGEAATRNFYREFMVPGMGHCGDVLGGYGPDTFDMMTPLVDWVEQGVPPDAIVASSAPNFESGLPFSSPPPGPWTSRILCAYPEEAAYVSGDPFKYTSFKCENGLTGLPSPRIDTPAKEFGGSDDAAGVRANAPPLAAAGHSRRGRI